MTDLRSTLHDLVDEVPVGPPPTEAMLGARKPRRWAVPLAAAAAVLAVIGGVATVELTRDGDRRQEPAPAPTPRELGEWESLPAMPLSPRSDVLAAYVDGQVVVVGGSDATVRGGPWNMPELRDGAAYELESGEWRTIATAPKALLRQAFTHVVVDDQLVVPTQSGPSWLVYDLSDDAWRSVPAPEGAILQPTMAVVGDEVYVLDQHVAEADTPVEVLDLTTDTWREIPLSPQQPRLSDRTLLVADDRLVVMGGELHPRGEDDWRRARADVWDGEQWTRSVAPDNVRGAGWHWTGERVISLLRSPRSEYLKGPLHGWAAATFDPVTGAWGRLPWPPREPRDTLGGQVGVGPLALSFFGLYDDRTGETTPVSSVPGGWVDTTSSSVVMTDDAIVVMGGSRPADPEDAAPSLRSYEVELTNRAWIRTLPE